MDEKIIAILFMLSQHDFLRNMRNVGLGFGCEFYECGFGYNLLVENEGLVKKISYTKHYIFPRLIINIVLQDDCETRLKINYLKNCSKFQKCSRVSNNFPIYRTQECKPLISHYINHHYASTSITLCCDNFHRMTLRLLGLFIIWFSMLNICLNSKVSVIRKNIKIYSFYDLFIRCEELWRVELDFFKFCVLMEVSSGSLELQIQVDFKWLVWFQSS